MVEGEEERAMQDETKTPKKAKTSSPGKRLETGPVQMPDDWPGVFIRGDQALMLANVLRRVTEALKEVKSTDSFFDGLVIGGFAETLESCRQTGDEASLGPAVQRITWRRRL